MHPRVASAAPLATCLIAQPLLSFRATESSVRFLVPGVHHHRWLFFRHTLAWEKPRK
jgi:hypothetical protein